MKSTSTFSSVAYFANFLLFLATATFSSALKVPVGRNLGLEENGGIENVKPNTPKQVNVLNSSENSYNNNSTNDALGVIPTWIASSSSSPQSINRTRATKLLEKPLESQLISQFPESEPKQNAAVNPSPNHANFTKVESSSSSTTLPPQKRDRLLRRTYIPASAIPIKIPTTIPPQSNKRQGLEPITEIKFPYVVSPLEGSLGGLTGLTGLPPLSPIQFVKVLVATTPFLIPIIFIPLLIFTIGLLMLPVTRGNVFVDIGDMRSPVSSSMSMIPSFISSYVVNPLKTLSSGESATTLMAMPRSLAYDLGNKLVDTEQCVERISCEISARYLHPNWEQGNWRSIANTNWISRIMSYLWQRYPTVSRIAKSLRAVSRRTSDGDGEVDEIPKMMVRNKVDDSYRLLPENGNNVTTTATKRSSFSETSRDSISSSSREMCSRYTCQPKSLLRKFFSSAQSTVSRGEDGKSSQE